MNLSVVDKAVEKHLVFDGATGSIYYSVKVKFLKLLKL